MAKVVHATVVSHKDIDLAWLIDCTIKSVSFHEPLVWSFAFAPGRTLQVESLWRVITPRGVVLTSNDHGQRFGLPSPVDASKEVSILLASKAITSVTVDELTSDLTIAFGPELRLEVVATSAGYESWQIHDSAGVNYVAQGGGKVSTWTS
jgi:hypothetical protein